MKFIPLIFLMMIFLGGNAQDSSKVNTRYLKAANLAFTELKAEKQLNVFNQQQLQVKDSVITLYGQSLNDCVRANDTLNISVIPNLNKKAADNQQLYLDTKKLLKAEQVKKVALSVSLPVALVIGLIIGFVVHH